MRSRPQQTAALPKIINSNRASDASGISERASRNAGATASAATLLYSTLSLFITSPCIGKAGILSRAHVNAHHCRVNLSRCPFSGQGLGLLQYILYGSILHRWPTTNSRPKKVFDACTSYSALKTLPRHHAPVPQICPRIPRRRSCVSTC
jgi:hypothetical protein